MTGSVALELVANPVAPEAISGWTSQRFRLDVVSRDAALPPQQIQVNADDVVEIELQDGTRILVAGDDAERYFAASPNRGAPGGSRRVLQVPRTLAIPTLPGSGANRDGVGQWLLKSVSVFRQDPAAATAVAAAGSFQDAQLENRRGLYRLGTRGWSMFSMQAMPPSPDPVLLFVHGTASSTPGSFKALWDDEARTALLEQLVSAYGDRVYGFEHRSLTEGPIQNALELVQALPPGARLHVVSHSRGGLVGELLARANRTGDDPFTEADIQRFLQQGERSGRTGYVEDAERLRKLSALMLERRIRVERFVRVAATARGTTLASGRLDRWATVMLNLFGNGLAAIPGLQSSVLWYPLLKNFLLAVVKERTDARTLPGLEAQMPDSPVVALLNAPDVVLDAKLHVIAGDYVGAGVLPWLADLLSHAFYGGQTDLVVNTPSMSGGASRKDGIWVKAVAGSDVHHLSYFRRAESVRALGEALLGDDRQYQRLAGPSTSPIARGGVHDLPNPSAPIALVLPGIMGSHLSVGRRIWMNPIEMIAGGMGRIKVDVDVVPDGWMDQGYDAFAKHLQRTHEVRPFTYDWRRSIAAAADSFGAALDRALKDSEARGKPLRIVAHSMGGLVARLALASRWDRFRKNSENRLVQFGTPNAGSHSIATVLTGRDGFVQMIERWLDWKHDMRQFLDIVREFPGVLELLPWPGPEGKAADGNDYYSPALWDEWCALDEENKGSARGPNAPWQTAKGAGDGWNAPGIAALSAARSVAERIAAAPLDPDFTCYVAGQAPTPVRLRFQSGQFQIGWSDQGDGRVPYATGIPPGVKTWYTPVAHGDLLAYKEGFDEYVRLLDTGRCELPSSPASISREVREAPALLAPLTLYPTEEEVVAAALGGRLPTPRARPMETTAKPATVRFVHGSLASADAPLLLGGYANDPLRGTAAFVDKHLGGRLQQAQAIGRYPARPGDAAVFRPPPGTKLQGSIVVGLGPLGQLQPGDLTRAFTGGLLEYASEYAERLADGSPRSLTLCSVLVGSGFGGVSLELCVRCLFEALAGVNPALERAGIHARIAAVTVYEEELSRVVTAAKAAQALARTGKFAGRVLAELPVREAAGGYRAIEGNQAATSGWRRVHITRISPLEDGLRFTLVANQAHNSVDEEPSQRQAVDGLLQAATGSTSDQPGLSRALFELMIPNGLKQGLADVEGIVIGIDAESARYPWELMRDEAQGIADPLVTRVCVVRQLASTYGGRRVATVTEHNALVIGDTQSGAAELQGAQQEARAVADMLQSSGFSNNLLLRPPAQKVLENLFDRRWRILHLAAHGIAGQPGGPIGMVLGQGTYLTTAQIAKLRHVPELVFINCCHLGSMAPEADRGRLAANLATEFIEMGCKAVIAAGWAVDDAAASTFATAFYKAMLEGAPFGVALRTARQETFRRHPASNTWGAYQAYGDERYHLLVDADDWKPSQYVHVEEARSDIERLAARMSGAHALPDEKRMYEGRLQKIADMVNLCGFGNLDVKAAFLAAQNRSGTDLTKEVKRKASGKPRGSKQSPDAERPEANAGGAAGAARALGIKAIRTQ